MKSNTTVRFEIPGEAGKVKIMYVSYLTFYKKSVE